LYLRESDVKRDDREEELAKDRVFSRATSFVPYIFVGDMAVEAV
jgi:hypothetical protein